MEQLPLQLTQADPCAEQDPREWLEGLAVLLPRLLQRAGASPGADPSGGPEQPFPFPGAGGLPLPPPLSLSHLAGPPGGAPGGKAQGADGRVFNPSFFEPKMLWLKEERADLRPNQGFSPAQGFSHRLAHRGVCDRICPRPASAGPRPSGNWRAASCPAPAQLGSGGKDPKAGPGAGPRPGDPRSGGGHRCLRGGPGAGLVEGQFGDATGTSTCLSCCLGEGSGVEGAVPHVIPERELCILPLSSGGGTSAWALQELGGGVRYHELRKLRAVPPGADGLLFLPYLTGERSPLWDEGAKGVFFGITAEHTRAHFLRAVLEGCAPGYPAQCGASRSYGFNPPLGPGHRGRFPAWAVEPDQGGCYGPDL